LLPFPLDRYSRVSKEYFTEEFTTVAQENLMPENQGMVEEDMVDFDHLIHENPDAVREQ